MATIRCANIRNVLYLKVEENHSIYFEIEFEFE
jgi:hypothetical protein